MQAPVVLYEHDEPGTPSVIFLCVVAIGVAILARAVQTPAVLIVAALLVGSAFMFSHFRVRVTSVDVSWAFGTGFPHESIALVDIASAQATTTTLLSGIGIHLTVRGWLWNVHSGGAVYIERTNGRGVLVGTSDPLALVAAIEQARSGRM